MAVKILLSLLTSLLLLIASKLLYNFVAQQQMMDFAMVWESTKLLVAGENPYILAGYKIGLNRPTAGNWYPPILFSLVLPFVFVSFNFAKFIWIAVSFIGHIVSYFLLIKWESRRKEVRILSLLILLTFYPVFHGIGFGQTSQLLVLPLSYFFYETITKQRSSTSSFCGGLALSITSIKPQNLFLLFIYLAARSLRVSEYKTVLGIATGFFLLLLPPLSFNINVLDECFGAFGGVPTHVWLGPNFGTWLQIVLDKPWSALTKFMPSVVAVSLVGVVFIIRGSQKDEASTLLLLPALSLIFSPYGWIHDQVVLLPVLYVLIGKAVKNGVAEGTRLLYFLLFLNVTYCLTSMVLSQQYFVFYPVIILVLVRFYFRKNRINADIIR